MLELLTAGLTRKTPGNNNLVNFYQDPNDSSRKAGFLGEVDYTALPVLPSLFTLVGAGSGNILQTTIPWLKFYLDGRILFVPKKPIVRGGIVNWQTLYNKGLVYGVKGVGGRPIGAGVQQYKTIQYDGLNYIVRLFRRLNGVDPLPYTGSFDNRPEFQGSEFQRLIPNILAGDTLFGQEGEKWASYTATTDLGLAGTSTPGGLPLSAENINANDSITRSGSISGNVATIGRPSISDTGTYIGWWPVLEYAP